MFFALLSFLKLYTLNLLPVFSFGLQCPQGHYSIIHLSHGLWKLSRKTNSQCSSRVDVLLLLLLFIVYCVRSPRVNLLTEACRVRGVPSRWRWCGAVPSFWFRHVSACADTHKYPKLCGSMHMTLSNLSFLHFPVSPPPLLSIPSCALFYSSLLTPSSSLPLVCRLVWQDKRPGIAAYVLPLSPLTLSTAHTALARC